MALIKPNFTDLHGLTHENAYVCINAYTVNAFKKKATVTLHFYPSNEEKDGGYRPIRVIMWSCAGETYDAVFGDPPVSPEDTPLAGIYEHIVDPERTDNEIFHDTLPIFEKIIKEDGEVHEYEVGEEINRKKAVALELEEGVDYETVDTK